MKVHKCDGHGKVDRRHCEINVEESCLNSIGTRIRPGLSPIPDQARNNAMIEATRVIRAETLNAVLITWLSIPRASIVAAAF